MAYMTTGCKQLMFVIHTMEGQTTWTAKDLHNHMIYFTRSSPSPKLLLFLALEVLRTNNILYNILSKQLLICT